MAKTDLAWNAARYVGATDKPRQSISVGPETVLLIVGDDYALLYNEVTNVRGEQCPSGIHFRITPRRAARIRDAFATRSEGAE